MSLLQVSRKGPYLTLPCSGQEEKGTSSHSTGGRTDEAWKSQEDGSREQLGRAYWSPKGTAARTGIPKERQSSRPPRTVEGWEENLIPTAKLNRR